jgi:hypothetical protein
MTSSRLYLALIIWISVATIAGAQPGGDRPVSKRYHDHVGLSDRLRSLAVDPRVSLTSLGKSYDERDVWAVVVSGPDPTPAIYLDAGHDGRDVTASAVALVILESFLALPSASLDSLLAEVSLHIVPRVSPDAIEATLRRPAFSDGRIPRPIDDDRDGDVDEDAPGDIDGDGVITWMRVLDPAGSWVVDSADERLLVKREDEDDGPFYRRYLEGLDDDGDGLLNEDPPGGVNVLNNFPQGWEMPAVEPNGGPFAASERETVAILEHFVAHPEIACVITLSQGRRLRGRGTVLDRAEQADAESRRAAGGGRGELSRVGALPARRAGGVSAGLGLGPGPLRRTRRFHRRRRWAPDRRSRRRFHEPRIRRSGG